MKLYNFITLIFFVFFISSNSKEKTNELKGKDINHRERDFFLKEQNSKLKDDTLTNEVNKKNDFEKINAKKTPITNPELLFAEWENNLKQKSIFDYVTKKDCENFDKMSKLQERGKYPMHTESKSIIPFEFNNDKVKDYLINYTLLNCLRGNGWTTDFIFFTSQNGGLTINEELTNNLKTKIKNYVIKNYGSDNYIKVKEDYIIVKSFKIIRINNNICYGEFDLSQDGASCCPAISGNFQFNINANTFNVYNLKNNEY